MSEWKVNHFDIISQAVFKIYLNMDRPTFEWFCDICFKKFHSDLVVINHMKLCHNVNLKIEKSLCEICGKLLTSYKSLNSHQYEFHYKPYKLKHFSCDICGRKVKSKKTLKQHKLKHVFQYICYFCELRYRTLDNLILHQKLTHDGDKLSFSQEKVFKNVHNKYKCLKCSESFSNQTVFFKHGIIKHDLLMTSERMRCKKCGKYFLVWEGLASHMEKFHFVKITNRLSIQGLQGCNEEMRESKSSRRFCLNCGKMFDNAGKVKRHEDQCILKSKGACDFQKHTRIEKNGETTLNGQCDRCKKGFKDASLLAYHEKYVCSITNKDKDKL